MGQFQPWLHEQAWKTLLSPCKGAYFWQGRLLGLYGLPTENADYFMLVNESAWIRSRVLILPERALRFSFTIRAQTEMKIWCITGMCIPKVVSSEKFRC